MEQFHDLCLEEVTEDILEEVDPLHSFVKHITKKSNPWFDEECKEALKSRWALGKRVRQSREFRGENVCPPKQYLNGKNGIDITNPKDIANKHAAAFTDNSSAH